MPCRRQKKMPPPFPLPVTDLGAAKMEVALPQRPCGVFRARRRGASFCGFLSVFLPPLLHLAPLLGRDHVGDVAVTAELLCLDAPRGEGLCLGDSGGALVCDGAVHGVYSYSPRRPSVEAFASVHRETATRPWRPWRP